MMVHIRRFLCLLLCLLLPLSVGAEEHDGKAQIVQDLIAYYFHYRDAADQEIENQLQTLASLDPAEGALWRQVMDSWRWINEEMPVTPNVLPDGLPGDPSLCIVVLGYGLNSDGSMKPELVDRLEVALASAEKYPQSYVLCTGGETSRIRGITEAGQMGQWLLEQGLPEGRLILETDALSTTENAEKCLNILWRQYPQVSSLAMVTSDYHIPWGTAVFQTMISLWAARQGRPELEILGNACCITDTPDRDTLYSQAWGISILAGLPFDSTYVPRLYLQETEATPAQAAAIPAALPAPEAEEEAKARVQPPEEPVVPVILGLAAVMALLFWPRKRKSAQRVSDKKKSGSD